jgi:hypothetical protein
MFQDFRQNGKIDGFRILTTGAVIWFKLNTSKRMACILFCKVKKLSKEQSPSLKFIRTSLKSVFYYFWNYRLNGHMKETEEDLKLVHKYDKASS